MTSDLSDVYLHSNLRTKTMSKTEPEISGLHGYRKCEKLDKGGLHIYNLYVAYHKTRFIWSSFGK